MHATTSDKTHPLVATLARITAVDTNFYADIGVLEADWFRATDFVQADSTNLAEALKHQAVSHPQMDQRTRGSYFMGQYTWFVPATAITAYLAEKRVPDLSLDNLALRFNKYTWHSDGMSGEAERLDVRFLSGRFAALPDDPAADHPDAIILPNENAMREWLRKSLETHLTPLIENINTRTRLGFHAQWCLVADACAALFLYRGEAVKAEARGQAEGLAFVKAADSPMNNPRTGYVTLQYQDQCETFRARGGCCRYYTVAEGGDKCSTCVLRKPEERDQLLRDYMIKKYDCEAAS